MSSPPSSPPAERIRYRQIVAEGDAERIQQLVESTGVFSVEEAHTAGNLVRTTLAKSETYRFLLAERRGELLGYTCFDRIPLSAVSFDLYWIAVAPQERGTGLALDLMERTASFCRKKRGLWIFAETSSRAPYAPARRFYEKAGFEKAAAFKDFYAAGDDKIIYRLAL